MLKALKRGADRTGISWAAGKLASGGKWIADHTGISWLLGKFSSGGKWIAGKLSSGWKWLFSSKTDTTENSVPKQSEPAEQHTEPLQTPVHGVDNFLEVSEEEEKSAEQQTEPLPLQTPVHGVDNFLEVKDKRLVFNFTKESFEEYKDCKQSDGKLRMFIERGRNKFCITGTANNENSGMLIESIEEIDNSVENDKNKYSSVSLRSIANVTLAHVIRAISILKENDHGERISEAILSMTYDALHGKVAVKVSNEPFVAQQEQQPKVNEPVVNQTTTPEQQPKVNEPIVNQTTTPKQPEVSNDNPIQVAQQNNEPVVDQTTTPKQPKAQESQAHTVMLDVGYFIGEGDNLVLSMTSERYQELKGSTYLYIKNDKAEYRVTVSGNYSYHEGSGRYDVPITSIVEIKGGVLYESENIVEDVKKLLKPGVVAFVESISTKYSGKSLHVVQCPPLVTGYVRVDDDKLIFVIEDISPERYEGYINSKNTKEHLFFIQCGGKEYRITGVLDGNIVSINSIVEMENGMEKGEIFCPADHMEIIKTKLGLLDQKLNCTVTHHTAYQLQQNGKPVVTDTMSDSMAESSASVYSDAQSTLGSTDAKIVKDVVEGMVNGVASDQSIGDSDSEYDSDTNARKDFFGVYSSVIAKKELKKSDSMAESSASFFSATSGASDASETLSLTDDSEYDSDTTITNITNAHCDTEVQEFDSMTASSASFSMKSGTSDASATLGSTDAEIKKDVQTVVEDLLSKTCGEKPDSLINQTTTKKEEVVAGEKSL